MTINFQTSSHYCTFMFSKITLTTLSHSAHINRLVLATVPFHTCPASLFTLSLPLAAIPPPLTPWHPHSVVFPLRACGQITRESDPLPSITALRRARRAADYFWDFIDRRLRAAQRSVLRTSTQNFFF